MTGQLPAGRKVAPLVIGLAALAVALILTTSTAAAIDTEVGEEIYSEKCWYCHQDDGMGTGLWGQPNFTREGLWLNTSKEEFISLVKGGGEVMPGFGNLTRAQVKNVLGYTARFADVEYEEIGANARAATIDAVRETADAATNGDGAGQSTDEAAETDPDAEDAGDTSSPGFTALAAAAAGLVALLLTRRR